MIRSLHAVASSVGIPLRNFARFGKESPERLVYRALTCALVGVGLLVFATLKAGAQPQPGQVGQVRVVQNTVGALFIVQGSRALPLNPGQLGDTDLANLSIGDEIDGTLPAVQAAPDVGPPLISYASDGTLYFVTTTTADPLVPDSIADADLAALTVGPGIDAVLPQGLWAQAPSTDNAGNPVAPAPPRASAVVVPSPSARVASAPQSGTLTGPCTDQRPIPPPMVASDAVPITGTVDLSKPRSLGDPPPLIATGATITTAVRYSRSSVELMPDDTFAIRLSCGTTYRFTYSSTSEYAHAPLFVLILDPWGAIAAHIQVHDRPTPDARDFSGDCWDVSYIDWKRAQVINSDCTFTPTFASGVYMLEASGGISAGAYPQDAPEVFTFRVDPT